MAAAKFPTVVFQTKFAEVSASVATPTWNEKVFGPPAAARLEEVQLVAVGAKSLRLQVGLRGATGGGIDFAVQDFTATPVPLDLRRSVLVEIPTGGELVVRYAVEAASASFAPFVLTVLNP